MYGITTGYKWIPHSIFAINQFFRSNLDFRVVIPCILLFNFWKKKQSFNDDS